MKVLLSVFALSFAFIQYTCLTAEIDKAQGRVKREQKNGESSGAIQPEPRIKGAAGG